MEKVGWMCSYTPVELIDAAGAVPVGIKSDSGAEHEDVLLGDSVCSFARSCMGGALTGVYDDLKGVVIAHSCECMRKLADGWQFRQLDIKPELIHILDVPKVVSESSIIFFAKQLQRFQTVLEQRFGEISPDALRRSIAKYNRTRELFGKIEEMRKEKAPPVSGREMEELVSAFFHTPADQLHPRLEEFIASKKAETVEKELPRVMLIGGPGNSSLIPAIENAGGLSVAEHMCTGFRSYAAPVQNDEDPLLQLSRMYLSKTACPRML
ncbi:MAG: 2-hydroxyacyl-CoA dehydratase family protein, partial [Desulfosalsimonadaceae bacterium]